MNAAALCAAAEPRHDGITRLPAQKNCSILYSEMNSTSSRPLQTIVLTIIIIGILAIALSGYLTPLTRFILRPFVGIQTFVSSRYQALQDFITSPRDMATLREKNLQYEAEIARLQSQIIELQEQIADTKVLSALLDFAQANPEHEYTAGTVIAYDTSPFLRYVIINRGSDNGLRRGMPVVTHQGLIGRIAAVSPSAARVQLITDPGSKVNVRLQPSQVEAMLNGSVTGDINIDQIPQDAAVNPGDLVLTSGLGGNFPGNILIGQVSGVRRRDYDLFQSASVQPVADFSKLKIVLVITNFNPVDVTPLIPTPGTP